ncbi:MAG: PfkB family carbohydrate kinase [Candidatus Margulisiibacteriota bacterium]
MSISIVGSVAFDTLHSPEGTKEKILGGSAVYAAIAASYFTFPAVIGVVGEDFHAEKLELLQARNIDILDIQNKSGKTFHWTGSYLEDINSAKTVSTEIGVLGDFHPILNEKNAERKILFLANNDPTAQLEAVLQSNSEWIAMDTMNLWITLKREEVIRVAQKVQFLFINDAELRMLANHYNLIQAAKAVFEEVPSLKYLILKRGEHGASLFTKDDYFTIGAFPLELVKDPTGAGDSFAGSFLGHLADKEITMESLKEALLLGTVTSSFTVEEFGPERLLEISREQIESRKEQLIKYLSV